MKLTIRISWSPGYFPQYSAVAYNDDEQRNPIKGKQTKDIVSHLVVWCRKEVEAHTLDKLGIVWMAFHMKNNTLKVERKYISTLLFNTFWFSMKFLWYNHNSFFIIISVVFVKKALFFGLTFELKFRWNFRFLVLLNLKITFLVLK